MKKKIISYAFLVWALFVVLFNSKAQTAENGKVIITGSRFTYSLVERWISEFKKQYPDVPFRIIPRGGPNIDSANLIINAHTLAPEEIRPGYKVVNIGTYVLLPVANAKSPFAKEATIKGVKEKEIKTVFFKKYDEFEVVKKTEKKPSQKNEYTPTLYTRLEKACAPTTFARNFGFEQIDILGKKIAGDDKHLISAIERDTNGLTYNNLGAIYDLKTRNVKPGLAVIPVDLNNNGKLDEEENFYGTLDSVIDHLEKKKESEITTSYVNISFPEQTTEANKNITLFLNWVLEEGQQYNHEYGFLNFEKENLAQQKTIVLSTKE